MAEKRGVDTLLSGVLKILRIINSHEGALKEYQPFVR